MTTIGPPASGLAVFSLDTFADAKFVIATCVSILTLLLTVFAPLQAFLNTAVRRHTVPRHPITR